MTKKNNIYGYKQRMNTDRNKNSAALISGLILIAFSLYLFFALIWFIFSGKADQSIVDSGGNIINSIPKVRVENSTGRIGAWFANLIFNKWFGIASFILPFIIFTIGYYLTGKRINNLSRKIILSLLSMLWISLFIGYISDISSSVFDINGGYPYWEGGHGYYVNLWLQALIGKMGTLIFLLLSFAILLFFCSKPVFFGLIRSIKKPLKNNNRPTDSAKENTGNIPEEKPEEAEFKKETFRSGDENILPPTSREKEIEAASTLESSELLTINKRREEEVLEEVLSPPTEDYDPTLELSNYKYPVLNLLQEYSSGDVVTKEEMEENNERIVQTLSNYKIDIIKIKATPGPTVTLYEIIPAPGIKISKIKNLEDDIALSLSALGIRIIAPIPGAGTIGIEVPNKNPEIVSMRSIIASKKFQEAKYALPVALGRTISNEIYTFDLTKMPHLLVAGATGQGKSVGLNAIITSLLYKKHPSQLKFVMVDPKKVELSIYSVIEKHFLAKLPGEEEPIITETSKVINTLNSLCVEMDNRYDLLKTANVRNIKEYNQKFVKRRLNPNKGHNFLPYIVVIIDEFADLIMTAGKEIEQPIARIAQLARAVGIHMIIATQRPSTNIITGSIKANFPARIAFKVASMIDSRTILDSPGANQLVGRGDMLISSGSDLVRVQCAFVDTPEVDAVTDFIARQTGFPSAFMLPEYVPEPDKGGAEFNNGERDPLFEEAARLIVNTQQGSTSSIQRRFSIGYNRAGRIMDQLEAMGVVGPFEGSKPRAVLIPDEYSLNKFLNDLSDKF